MLKLLLLTFFCAAQATTSLLLPNMRDETKTIKIENKLLSEDAKSYIFYTEILAGVATTVIAHCAADRLLGLPCYQSNSTTNEYLMYLLQSAGRVLFGAGAGCLGSKIGGWCAKRYIMDGQ